MAIVPLVLVTMTAAANANPGQDDECVPQWVATFGGEPGLSEFIADMTVYDDGSGLALYACGNFESIGGIPIRNIARWDGSNWSQVGNGLTTNTVWGGSVSGMTSFDDGSGMALFASGYFTDPISGDVSRLAKWDGATWTFIDAQINQNVADIQVFDDGTGDALYLCGSFSSVNGIWARRVARWDGEVWTALGDGLSNSPVVRTLVVFNDGTGAALYAGGDGWNEGGVPVPGVSKWNGTEWVPLEGLPIPHGETIRKLAVFDDALGAGPALFAAGSFTKANGVEVPGIARWDGTNWTPVGEGLSGVDGDPPAVSGLTVFDDGSGPALYAGGGFVVSDDQESQGIAKWDGATWTVVGGGVSGEPPRSVVVMQGFDDGAGPALFAFGSFEQAGSVIASNLAKWQNSNWESIGGAGFIDRVRVITTHDDGSEAGPQLYLAGANAFAGVELSNSVHKWDGENWIPVGNDFPLSYIWTLESVGASDDGDSLLLAGGLVRPDPHLHSGLSIWDGKSWSLIEASAESNSVVSAIETIDGGSGVVLYAAGQYMRGDKYLLGVSKWDGVEWSRIGVFGLSGWIHSLQIFDDGSGPSLYVGGSFVTTMGSPNVSTIARWDGSQWAPLGSGLNSEYPFFLGVRSMAVFDDGSGPALYVGGVFETAGEVPARNIAKWDGEQWSALGDGLDGEVDELVVFNDGSGPALYAGGWSALTSGQQKLRPAKWDGTSWTPVGTGSREYIRALAAFHNHPSGKPSLFAGGDFSTMVDSTDSYLARYEGCPILIGDVNSDEVVDWRDLIAVINAWGPCPNPTACLADANGDGKVNVSDLLAVLANWNG